MLVKPTTTWPPGSIGGLTRRNDTDWQSARARTIPVDPQTNQVQPLTSPTTLQQVPTRQDLARSAHRWTGLSGATKTAWNTYGAATPVPSPPHPNNRLNGFQHYVRSNSLRQHHALPFVDAAPTINDLGTLGTISAVAALVVSSRVWGMFFLIGGSPPWSSDDNGALVIRLSPGTQASAPTYTGPFAIADDDVIPGNSTTPPVLVITDSRLPGSAQQRGFMVLRALESDGRATEPSVFFDFIGSAPP